MTQVQFQEQIQQQKPSQEPCTWCLKNAGRTHANRKCCQLRRLAMAPRHAQAEFAKSLTDGERAALRPRLVAEIKRLRAIKEPANAAPAASAGPPARRNDHAATSPHPTQNKQRHALKIESDT